MFTGAKTFLQFILSLYTAGIIPILGVPKMPTRSILHEYTVSTANILGEVKEQQKNKRLKQTRNISYAKASDRI